MGFLVGIIHSKALWLVECKCPFDVIPDVEHSKLISHKPFELNNKTRNNC